jgi:hypothetical protein
MERYVEHEERKQEPKNKVKERQREEIVKAVSTFSPAGHPI